MSSLQKIEIKKATITPEAGSFEEPSNPPLGYRATRHLGDKRLVGENITPHIVQVDYFEDILSPAVTCYLKISNTTNLYNRVPIRGYERVDLTIGTTNGDFQFDDGADGRDECPFYVIGIQELMQVEGQETFTLVLSTLENLRNETSRCQRRYERLPISSHVQDILENTLKVPTERIAEVEPSITPYGFIGNNKKPFHICTWLAPKAQPGSEGTSGTSGSGGLAEAKGTSGFFFYENYDGYHFRSVDSMIKSTAEAANPLAMANRALGRGNYVPTYTATSMISRDEGSGENDRQIIHHYMDKNTNVQKNLRVGLYSNLTYFYNPLTWQMDAVKYNLKAESEGNVKTLGDKIPIPEGDITTFASRLLVRIGDTGMWDPSLVEEQGEVPGSGRDNSDMAKAFSRYTLLFTQSLYIVIPCDVKLRAGQVIKVELPVVGPTEGDNKEIDQESSGYYLIRSLRHHFEIADGRNTTSLNLVRDSYGQT